MKASEEIVKRIQEAELSKENASIREVGYWAGKVDGLKSALDVALLAEAGQ